MFRRLPWSAPLLSSFFFAVMAISVKVLTQSGMESSQVIFLRSVLPTVFVLPLAWAEGRHVAAPPRATWLGLLARGICGASAMVCYFLALANAPTAVAVLTGNTSPVWTAVFASVFLKEVPPRNLAWALPLAMAGSALVCAGQVQHLYGDLWLGAGLGLASALFSGMAYTCVRQLRSLPASWVTLSLTATATLVTLPWVHAWSMPAASAWGWILIMGLSAALAQWLMTVGYFWNSAAAASTLGLCAVFFSTLLGHWILHESVTPWQCAGILAVLIGVVAVIPRPEQPS